MTMIIRIRMITITVIRMITRMVTIIITTSVQVAKRTQVGLTHGGCGGGHASLCPPAYKGANNSLICIRRDVNPCSCR